MTTAIWWIRRDMRLSDNKALQAASARGEVIPLFIVDPVFENAGSQRRAYMYATLRDLDSRMENALILRHGDPVTEVVKFAQEVGATSVHIARDFAPY